MSIDTTIFETIWQNNPSDVLLRYELGMSNIGVMALADIQPAAGTDHMVVIVPSMGAHNGEKSLAQYPQEITFAFDALSNYFDLLMQPFAEGDRVVKRMVSNNKVKNHPHQVLYIADRPLTLSEQTPRLTGAEAAASRAQTLADLHQEDDADFTRYLLRGFITLPS